MKKNGIMAVIISVIVLNVVLGTTGLILHFGGLNKEKEKQQEYSESRKIVDNNSRSYTCIVGIKSEEDYDVYIEEKIAYDDDRNTVDYYAKTLYEFDTDEAYYRLKDKLSECEDTYEVDEKIRCNIYKNNEEKNLLGKNADMYKIRLQEQGFRCEEN